jgi:alpha-tubulin suppressor-like RCC1 family protein
LSPNAGLMIICGGVNWDLIGRKELPKGAKQPPKNVNVTNLWGPHVWGENTRVTHISSSCVACHSALIDEDGKVYTWGRNESGQVMMIC